MALHIFDRDGFEYYYNNTTLKNDFSGAIQLTASLPLPNSNPCGPQAGNNNFKLQQWHPHDFFFYAYWLLRHSLSAMRGVSVVVFRRCHPWRRATFRTVTSTVSGAPVPLAIARGASFRTTGPCGKGKYCWGSFCHLQSARLKQKCAATSQAVLTVRPSSPLWRLARLEVDLGRQTICAQYTPATPRLSVGTNLSQQRRQNRCHHLLLHRLHQSAPLLLRRRVLCLETAFGLQGSARLRHPVL